MLKKVLRSLFTIIGIVIGYFIGVLLLKTEYLKGKGYFSGFNINTILFLILITLLFGFILFLISPWINNLISKVVEYTERSMQKLTSIEILFGAAGAIIALIISSLLASVLNTTLIGKIIYAVINIVAAVFGADIAIKRREDVMSFFGSFKKVGSGRDKKNKFNNKATPKVLDTSVIIDGRIFDICQTGFIEGTLIIPTFVLEELRHIADSSDSLKRNRGRRGLDILNKIQKELNIEVQISEKDFPEIAEVDSKLLKLAQFLDGKVITNDYNLNKVAEFQGVDVLNINELANAIKPVVLPGEEMTIQVIKDGKESGQGVAYLDDGTMIVVEGGRKYIGEIIDVVVTSVLQTAAGRMIFAKQKDAFERQG